MCACLWRFQYHGNDLLQRWLTYLCLTDTHYFFLGNFDALIECFSCYFAYWVNLSWKTACCNLQFITEMGSRATCFLKLLGLRLIMGAVRGIVVIYALKFVLMYYTTLNLNNSFNSLVWFTAYMTP